MTDVAVVQLVTFVTLVAGFIYQSVVAHRQRRWDLEDRRLLAQSVIDAAIEAEKHVTAQTTQLHDAIKENTEISTKAFHEANSVNLKIEALGLEHNELQREQQAKD